MIAAYKRPVVRLPNMSTPIPGLWLPAHQQHVLVTLAHVDRTIEAVGNMLYDYLKPPGPLFLTNVNADGVSLVKVIGIAPLPVGVPSLVADALTQLRAAIEHTLYAEVLTGLDRDPTTDEARSIEMPAVTKPEHLSAWFNHKHRKSVPPLLAGSDLANRIKDLQPFNRRDADAHPLRLLVSHTNLAKHRTPAVAATRLGAVVPDEQRSDRSLLTRAGTTALSVGDILASGPIDVPQGLSIWPSVGIERPHTNDWHVLMHELREIEHWVRTVAVPMLVTGRHDVEPLPPHIDMSVGYSDFGALVAAAEATPAAVRAEHRIAAHSARPDLVGMLAMYAKQQGAPVSVEEIEQWAASLTDAEIVNRVTTMGELVTKPELLLTWLDQVIAEVMSSGGT
jgi:hypothetical protein